VDSRAIEGGGNPHDPTSFWNTGASSRHRPEAETSCRVHHHDIEKSPRTRLCAMLTAAGQDLFRFPDHEGAASPPLLIDCHTGLRGTRWSKGCRCTNSAPVQIEETGSNLPVRRATGPRQSAASPSKTRALGPLARPPHSGRVGDAGHDCERGRLSRARVALGVPEAGDSGQRQDCSRSTPILDELPASIREGLLRRVQELTAPLSIAARRARGLP